MSQESIQKVFDGIYNGLFWRFSKEGWDYWNDVCVKLENMGAEKFNVNLKNNVDKDLCTQAAVYLLQAFLWKTTPEGYDYWLDVYRNICQYINKDPTLEGQQQESYKDAYERAMGVI